MIYHDKRIYCKHYWNKIVAHDLNLDICIFCFDVLPYVLKQYVVKVSGERKCLSTTTA